MSVSLFQCLFGFFLILFIYLFLAMLSSLLRGLFCSCSKRGLLITGASLVAESRLESLRASEGAASGLSSFRSWTLEHRLNSCGTWT